MAMFEICPLCRHVREENEQNYCGCVRKDYISEKDFIWADERLAGVALKLMDKGFLVRACLMDEILPRTKTAIRIHFDKHYEVESLFREMPPDWHTETFTPSDNKSFRHTVLVDYLEWSDSEEDMEGELTLTISNLETWVEELDGEAVKAVLTLAGYPVAPITHKPDML